MIEIKNRHNAYLKNPDPYPVANQQEKLQRGRGKCQTQAPRITYPHKVSRRSISSIMNVCSFQMDGKCLTCALNASQWTCAKKLTNLMTEWFNDKAKEDYMIRIILKHILLRHNFTWCVLWRHTTVLYSMFLFCSSW